MEVFSGLKSGQLKQLIETLFKQYRLLFDYQRSAAKMRSNCDCRTVDQLDVLDGRFKEVELLTKLINFKEIAALDDCGVNLYELSSQDLFQYLSAEQRQLLDRLIEAASEQAELLIEYKKVADMMRQCECDSGGEWIDELDRQYWELVNQVEQIATNEKSDDQSAVGEDVWLKKEKKVSSRQSTGADKKKEVVEEPVAARYNFRNTKERSFVKTPAPAEKAETKKKKPDPKSEANKEQTDNKKSVAAKYHLRKRNDTGNGNDTAIGNADKKPIQAKTGQPKKKLSTRNWRLQKKLLHCNAPGCKFKTFFIFTMDNHRQTVHRNTPLELVACPECGKRYQNYNYWRRHQLICHTPETLRYRCDHPGCDKLLPNPSAYKRHKEVHNKPSVKCPLAGCDKRFKSQSRLLQHRLNTHGTSQFKCDHPRCGRAFKHKFNLVGHQKKMHGYKFACDYPRCGRMFRLEKSLTAHRRKHFVDGDPAPKLMKKNEPLKVVDEQPKESTAGTLKVCQWPGCDYQSNSDNPQLFMKHQLRVHQKVRKHKCWWPGCGRRFFEPHDVRRHLAGHNSSKPVWCRKKICSLWFADVDTMSNHWKKRHAPGQDCCKCQGCRLLA